MVRTLTLIFALSLLVIPSVSVFAETRKPGDTFKDCVSCPEMVVVPAGSFMMGSPKNEKDREDNESPRREVTINKPFAVGKYEITRDQFQTFVDETGHSTGNKCWIYENNNWKERADRSYRNPGFTQERSHPVVCVNWNDAMAYVKWINSKVTGSPYKLLTEAEWEYVARAGTATPFWWGTKITTAQANYGGNYTYDDPKGKYRKKTVAVDIFKANKFGLYNVHGNVYEWVEDCLHKNYKGAPTDGSAWLKINGGNCYLRVLRGGSWGSEPGFLRSANRFEVYSVERYDFLGFRLSRTLAVAD